ncbi:MAG: ATP-binding protein, partial [Nannocystaceae bacterium]
MARMLGALLTLLVVTSAFLVVALATPRAGLIVGLSLACVAVVGWFLLITPNLHRLAERLMHAGLERDVALEVASRFGMAAKHLREAVVFHRQGKILDANHAAKSLFDQENLQGTHLIEYVDERYRELLLDMVATDQARSLDLKSRGTATYSITNHPKKSHDGITEPVSIAVIRDISADVAIQMQLTDARDSAETASKAKSTFLANMSHEVRTPMNAVIGMTNLLLDTKLNRDQRGFVETIRNSGQDLLVIINDILDFSKIESGKLKLESIPFSLSTCIEDVLDLFAAKSSSHRIEMFYTLTDEVPTLIVGDVTRLRQILVNLVGNALKFTDSGEIIIGVKSRPDGDRHRLQFSVRDTGVGIPSSRVDNLFNSFTQLDPSTTRKYGGTGLGLAISKRLSKIMGGRIWVESELGAGSIFYFEIVVDAAEDQPAVDLRLEGSRVIIVNGHQALGIHLAEMTRKWGIESILCSSGNLALRTLAREGSIDAFIIANELTDMDGLDLIERVRARVHGAQPPVILMTGPTDYSLRDQARSLQRVEPLTKPLKPVDLFHLLLLVTGKNQTDERSDSRNSTPRFDITFARRHPHNILLVEDHAVNQRVAIATLKNLGYDPQVACDGIEALTAL